MVVTIDSRGMTICEADLDGVIAHLRGGLRAGFGLEHGQSWRGKIQGRCNRRRFFFRAFFVAGGAGALFAQVSEVEMAGMAVGPDNVDTRAIADVDFDAGGTFALVDGRGHGSGIVFSAWNFRCSNLPAEWDCRADKFSDGREMSRCADRAPG